MSKIRRRTRQGSYKWHVVWREVFSVGRMAGTCKSLLEAGASLGQEGRSIWGPQFCRRQLPFFFSPPSGAVDSWGDAGEDVVGLIVSKGKVTSCKACARRR